MPKLATNHSFDPILISFSAFLVFVLSFLLSSILGESARANCHTLGFSPTIFALKNLLLLAFSVYLLSNKYLNLSGDIYQLSIGLVLGGGVFNAFEKMYRGCVLDYYSFFGLLWFNLADLAISIGVLTLLLRVGINMTMPK